VLSKPSLSPRTTSQARHRAAQSCAAVASAPARASKAPPTPAPAPTRKQDVAGRRGVQHAHRLAHLVGALIHKHALRRAGALQVRRRHNQWGAPHARHQRQQAAPFPGDWGWGAACGVRGRGKKRGKVGYSKLRGCEKRSYQFLCQIRMATGPHQTSPHDRHLCLSILTL
jgi:hypothetical protein